MGKNEESGASTQPAGVAALDRGIAILNAFTEAKPVMTLAELAAATGIYKSTILRLSQSLIRGHLLVRAEDGRYRIGPAALKYGTLYQAGLDMGEVVKPMMVRLTAETLESTIFYIREGDKRICWHRVDAPQVIRYNIRVGDVLPLDKGSGGRVISAFTGGREPEHEQIRKDYHWVAIGERNPDISGISVPIFSVGQKLVGALSLAGPQSRLPRPRLLEFLPLLLQEAARATHDLGGDQAPLLEVRSRILTERQNPLA